MQTHSLLSWAGPVAARIAIAVACLSCPAVSIGGARERPLSDVAWVAPPFDSLPARLRRDVLREADSAAYVGVRSDPRVSWRLWRYRSDSVAVVALVAAPQVRLAAARAAGTIVFCRGSFVQNGWLPTLVPRLHRLALTGFTVIAPQYRGSEGGQGKDEMGGADLEDVFAAIRLARDVEGGRGRPVYLYGESRGGMMVLQALRDGADVRAAATVGAFTDLDSMIALGPSMEQTARAVWPDWEARRTEIAARRSAVRWAEKIRAPLLILHGADDPQLPPRHAEWLDARLSAAGREHRLGIVPDAGHSLGRVAAWRDSTVMDWFRRHR